MTARTKKTSSEIIKAVRIGTSDAGRIVGKSLRALREMAGLTQDQLASHLSVQRSAISKIERRGDVQISALERYVAALGATLRIDAEFPANTELAYRLHEQVGGHIPDEAQLSFPIFGGGWTQESRSVVLSIRPIYSNKIMLGEKTVELRRRFPAAAPSGTLAYIYSTSPVRAIVGRARIVDVLKLPIADIWSKYSKFASVAKSDFEEYFSGLTEGFALKFADATPLPRPLTLTELREKFGFEPPQSFLYTNPALQRAIQNEYAVVSD